MKETFEIWDLTITSGVLIATGIIHHSLVFGIGGFVLLLLTLLLQNKYYNNRKLVTLKD